MTQNFSENLWGTETVFSFLNGLMFEGLKAHHLYEYFDDVRVQVNHVDEGVVVYVELWTKPVASETSVTLVLNETGPFPVTVNPFIDTKFLNKMEKLVERVTEILETIDVFDSFIAKQQN